MEISSEKKQKKTARPILSVSLSRALRQPVSRYYFHILAGIDFVFIFLLACFFLLRFFFKNFIPDYFFDIDFVPLMFIFVDLLFFYRLLRLGGVFNEKLWIRIFFFLIILNFVWNIGFENYERFYVYPFHIGENILILIVGLICIPTVQQYIKSFVSAARDFGFSREHSFPFLHEDERASRFFRWIVSHRRWFIFSVIFIITLSGLFLRFYKLNEINGAFYEDELGTLAAAEQYFIEGAFDYHRGEILTHSIIFLYKITGSHAPFVARSAVVFFGTLTIPLLYFLGKKIHPTVGVLSAFLWSYAPLVIGLSRYVREYTIYNFISCLFLLYLLYFLETIKKLRFTLRSLLKIVLLVPFFWYYFFINRASTFSLLLPIVFSLVFFYFVFDLLLHSSRRTKTFLRKYYWTFIPIIILLFFVFRPVLDVFVYHLDIDKVVQSGNALKYRYLFFEPTIVYEESAAQWFAGSSLPRFFLYALFLLPLLFLRKNKYIGIYFFVFAAYLVLFSYFANRYFSPRYIFYIFPFYVVLLSSALYIFFSISKVWGKVSYFFILLVFFFLFNPFNAYNLLETNIVSETQHDPKVGLRLRNFSIDSETADFIEKNRGDAEALLLTTNGLYYFYAVKYAQPPKQAIYFTHNNNPDLDLKRFKEILSRHQSGFVAADRSTKNFPLDLKNYSSVDPRLRYLGANSAYYFFTW